MSPSGEIDQVRRGPESPMAMLLRRWADRTTVTGVFLSTLSAVGVAGVTSADLFLGAAASFRLFLFLGPGLDLRELRRHGFLLVAVSLFICGGVLTGIRIGDPLQWEFLRAVIGMLGSVFVVACYTTDSSRLRRLVLAFALSGYVLALSAFVMEPKGADGRATGLSIHPNSLGHSCIMAIAACLFMFERAQMARAKWFWAMGMIAGAAAVMESGSRGSLLGLSLGALLYLTLSGRGRAALIAVAGAYLITVVSLLGIVHLSDNNPVVRMVTLGTSKGDANEERQEALRSAMQDVNDDPVFGKGFQDILVIHVVYLQGWVGAGALGAGALLVVGVGAVLWPLVQRRSGLALACGGAAVAFAWLFTNILSFRDQWLFLALVFRASDSPVEALERVRSWADRSGTS